MDGRHWILAIFLLIGANAAAQDIPAPNMAPFEGVSSASCQGTGPEGQKGQWQWQLAVSHQGDDGLQHPETLFVSESSPTETDIWVVSFLSVGQGVQTEHENGSDICNLTKTESAIAGNQLKGTIDSYGYPGCGTVAKYEAHWDTSLVLTSRITAVFSLNYRGYGGDYAFTCNLKSH
jgi:hypothetical protein